MRFGPLLWIGFTLTPLASFVGYRLWHQPKYTDATIDSAPAIASVTDPAPRKPCKVLDKEFQVFSNAWGHGSPYFGNVNKCANGVALNMNLWSASEADYVISSNSCPSKYVEGKVPTVDDRRGRLSAGLKKASKFLSTEIENFGNLCPIDPSTSAKLLDGFGTFYANELRASWIHNRYIEKLTQQNRLGWRDEKLQAEARQEYAKSH
jgi:hypothetical protein